MARAQLQVMGLERGAADVQLPSLLWGWPVLCPLAHAEVLAIDAHEALKDKRVLAVLTAQTPLHEPATRHQALLMPGRLGCSWSTPSTTTPSWTSSWTW